MKQSNILNKQINKQTKNSKIEIIDNLIVCRELINVRIIGKEILLPQTRPITSIDEFVEHILHCLANFYFDTLTNELSSLIGKEAIHRKSTQLWFFTQQTTLYVFLSQRNETTYLIYIYMCVCLCEVTII
jgi:hypothetical protein